MPEKRLTVNLDPEAAAALDALTDGGGRSYTLAINAGLKVLAWLREQEAQGATVQAIQKDGTVTKLKLFY